MAPPFASSSSSSWRTPSAALQVKYNLTALPEDFEPTTQENQVLDMYEKIRRYEKEAARLKEEAARAKLDAAAAKYEEAKTGSPANKKKKKKRKKAKPADADQTMRDADADESSEEDEDDDDDQQPMSLPELRAAKLEELREEVEETKKKDMREEELRAKLLGTGADNNQGGREDVDMGPSLKKKARREQDLSNKSSLIANITVQETPPHDFSEKLALKAWQGKVLFPGPTAKDVISWSPPASAMNPNDEALAFELDGCDLTNKKSNNTIAIKYMAPIDSKRFSFNIAGPNHNDYHSVLFHFNPRQEKGGLLVLNSKQEGMWGQAVNVPISRLPSKIFGEISSTVMIQIHDEGFDVYMEGKHCARLEHRDELKPGSKLHLQFAATDDRGNPESWSVYKVWWGHKDILAQEDLSDVHGVNAFMGMHPKKLFIKSLDMIHTDAQVELRRAQLERAFRKYGGDRGVVVTAPKNASFAFVECDSEQQASMALSDMADEYDIKRARRKKHEALQEERAAAEAATKESTEWN